MLHGQARGGISDSRFLAPHFPVLDFGLCNSTMHQIDENVPLSEIEILTNCYQQIIKQLI